MKEYLEGKGYYAVRAAGSHGLTDVLAISPIWENTPQSILFIQCKTGKARMSPADRERLYTDSLRWGAQPIQAVPDGSLITFQQLLWNGKLQEVYF